MLMKNKIKINAVLLMLLLSGNLVYSQLQVFPGGSVASLVQNVLLGTGVTASNITYTGSTQAIGKFITGSTPTNLGLSSGLMLATGNIGNAIGPNNSTSLGTDFSLPGDALLSSICGQTTHDASILEFDFVPQGDTMKFRYVFGSEEYPEFVTNLFNDIFGFFVSGLDPTDYLPFTDRNIAIVPGTVNTPVAIASINNVIPSYPQFYVNNTNGVSIQYDGFTTVLTAWCKVVPCTSYHIKLAIADAIDGIYDSGVFLEAGSFSSAGIITSISFSNPVISNLYAIEGCNDAIVTFTMPYAEAAGFVIPYIFDGSSTAIEGIDIDTLVNPLIIPPGSTSASIVVHPKYDTIADGPKTVVLIVPTSICMTEFDTVTFTVLDRPPLHINAGNDTTVACGTPTILHASHNGGLGPYTFLWNNGSTHDTAHVTPYMSNYFHVQITDYCGYSKSDSMHLMITGPIPDAGNDTAICMGDAATLTAHGGFTYHWSNGATTQTISVSPSVSTTYLVTVTQSCSAVDSVRVTVHTIPLVTITSNSDSLCPGDTLYLHASGATQYQWSAMPVNASLNAQSSLSNPVLIPAVTANYTLLGTDQYACSLTVFKQIVVKPTPTSTFNISKDIICEKEITSLTYTGSGIPSSVFNWNFSGAQYLGAGMGPYAIMWDNAGTYAVSLMVNSKGCKSLVTTDSIQVIPKPIVRFTGTPTSGCPPFVTYFADSSLNVTSNAAYHWSFGDGNTSISPDPTHNYHKSGVYSVQLIITNASGCADTLKKTGLIRVHPVPVASFTNLPQRVTIFDPTMKFYDVSMGNPVAWLWDFGDQTFSSDQNVTHVYADTGNYLVQLRVTNNKGCMDSIQGLAIVTPDNTIYFPNAFSPNGDGYNDIFRAYGTNLKAFNMEIFDRWGSRVFHSEHIDLGWDGTISGSYAIPGVYVVIVKYRDVWGGPHSYYGRVTLIR
jgi:gliding motility-associated-like protein